MKARTGDVIGAWTTDVIGHDRRFKHHLCVNEAERQFLFVNTRRYPEDVLLTSVECDGLTEEESWVSVSRVMHVAKFAKDASRTCTVSDDYLLALFHHAQGSRVTSEVDRRKILTGIAAHLNKSA